MMKLTEIVENIMIDNPLLRDKISKKEAVALIHDAFFQLVKKLDEQVEFEEVVRVQGLGSFRTRVVVKEKEGQKETEKRIIFRPAKTNPEKSE